MGVDEAVDIEVVNAVVLETAIVDRFPGWVEDVEVPLVGEMVALPEEYRISRLPAPQYSVPLSLHGMSQSAIEALAPAIRLLPQ